MADHQALAKSPATPPPPVLPLLDRELSPRASQILWALCDWAWGAKPYCWPSNQRIADRAGCSRRTVQLALSELRDAGKITTHMNRTNVGWYRSIVITDRVPKPRLAIIEPPDESRRGGATTKEGDATRCATPAQPAAPPLAQPVAPQVLESEKAEKRNSEATTGPKEGVPSPRRPEEEEPTWKKLDQLTPEDVTRLRAVAQDPAEPMAPIYAAVLRRYDRKYPGMRAIAGGKAGSGSPTKDSPDPASRERLDVVDSVQLDPTKEGETDQDKKPRTEHKTH